MSDVQTTITLDATMFESICDLATDSGMQVDRMIEKLIAREVQKISREPGVPRRQMTSEDIGAIARLNRQGLTDVEIAEQLQRSLSTVSRHRHRMKLPAVTQGRPSRQKRETA